MATVFPILRRGVTVAISENEAAISLQKRSCVFSFPDSSRPAVTRLIEELEQGSKSIEALTFDLPCIADEIPPLIEELHQLRFVSFNRAKTADPCISGSQLYRELRRLATRHIAREAPSSFVRALENGSIRPSQIYGYGFEYLWIVRMAPGLIAPMLASAHSSPERVLLENFLSSEIGHDKFISAALESVGFSATDWDRHLPLSSTFSIGASLGVYSRQHPLSFKACLFLLEEARPEFIDTFDARCRALGLPTAFYEPFRAHAGLNSEFDHGNLSRDLLALEGPIDQESAVAVKRHLALLIETVIRQERQILNYYGRPDAQLPRCFE